MTGGCGASGTVDVVGSLVVGGLEVGELAVDDVDVVEVEVEGGGEDVVAGLAVVVGTAVVVASAGGSGTAGDGDSAAGCGSNVPPTDDLAGVATSSERAPGGVTAGDTTRTGIETVRCDPSDDGGDATDTAAVRASGATSEAIPAIPRTPVPAVAKHSAANTGRPIGARCRPVTTTSAACGG